MKGSSIEFDIQVNSIESDVVISGSSLNSKIGTIVISSLVFLAGVDPSLSDWMVHEPVPQMVNGQLMSLSSVFLCNLGE